MTAGRSETRIPTCLLIGCCPSVVASCGRGHVAAGGGGGTTVGAARLAAGSACDRGLLSARDVAVALGDRVHDNGPIPGDPERCAFAASGGTSITVAVRRGLGRVTVDKWRRGRIPASDQSMPGAGDEAVFREVSAERHDLLCAIQASGPLRDASAAAVPGWDRLGALCRRIFAVAEAWISTGSGADSAH